MFSDNNITSAQVTVIVPVYKAEGTVEATVKSICNQTHKNLEILLVDDGSPDNSGKICDRLALDDGRIKVIHKKNGGVSSARNEAVRQATSELLCFVDSDDEIEATMVEKLVKSQAETGAQLVVAGLTEYHKKLTKTVCEKAWLCDFSEASDEQIVDICGRQLMCFPVAKLFLKSVFTENNLSFKEKLVCGEDHLLVFQYLGCIEKILFVGEALYRYYCFNSNGATRFFPLSGQISIFNAKIEFVGKNATEQAYKEYCARYALTNLIARFRYLAKRSIKNYAELGEAYDAYWKYISPYSENTQVFGEENEKWFVANKDKLQNKKIKQLYAVARKETKKKSKKMRHLEEFMAMPLKEKIKFIKKKL